MHRHFHCYLSRTDLSVARGVVFVDVLDCEDKVVVLQGAGLLDTRCGLVLDDGLFVFIPYSPGVGTLADGFGHDAKGHIVRKRGKLRMLHCEREIATSDERARN